MKRNLVWLCLTLFAVSAHASLAYVQGGTVPQWGGVTSITFTATITSATNSIMILDATSQYGNPTFSSIAYGGQSLTELTSCAESTYYTDLWYLANPPVGAANVTMTSSTAFWGYGTWGQYSGVNQSSPFATFSVAAPDTIANSLTITAVNANDFAYWAINSQGTLPTIVSPASSNKRENNGNIGGSWDAVILSAGSYNLAYTIPSSSSGTAAILAELQVPFTPTPSFTVSPTSTNTKTFTLTSTPSITPTFTITKTFTVSPSDTKTWTMTNTPSDTPTFSVSPTDTNTFTVSPTFSASPTATPTSTVTPLPGCGTIASNTLALWTLDGTLADSSGNGYNLTTATTPTYANFNCSGLGSDGLTGANEFGVISTSTSFWSAFSNQSVYTIQGWWYSGAVPAASGDCWLFQTIGMFGAAPGILAQPYGAVYVFAVWVGAESFNSTTPINSYTCYNVAATYNNGTVLLYVNNQIMASGFASTNTGTVTENNLLPFNVGTTFGSMDEWRVSTGVAYTSFPSTDGGVCTASPTYTYSATPTPSISPTFSISPTYTSSASPTDSPTNSPSPTATPNWTATPTPACGIYGQMTPSGNAAAATGIIVYKPVTLSFAYLAQVSTISAWVQSGTGQVQAAVYSDVYGSPWALLETSSQVYFSGAGWAEVSMPSDDLAPGNYWLAVEVSNTLSLQYDAGGTPDMFQYAAYGTFPATAQVQTFLGVSAIQADVCGY